MKKLIMSMLTALCVMIGTTALASEATAPKRYELLIKLGIISIPQTDRYITRADAAEMFSAFVGRNNVSSDMIYNDVSVSHPKHDAIAACISSGIMTTDEDGSFYPYRQISYLDFVVAAVRTAGFKDYSEINGGYPEGYLKTARKYDLISKSYDYSAPVDGMTATELLYNLLDIPYCEPDGIKSDTLSVTYRISDNYKVAEHYFDIIKHTGTITAFGDIYVNGYSARGGQTLCITDRYGTATYMYDEDRYEDFLGCAVDFYVNKESDTVIYVEYKRAKDISIVELDHHKIENIEADRSRIEYYENNKKKKIKLPADVTIIYNGSNNNAITPEDMLKLNVRIKAVDVDGDSEYEILFVYEYKSAVVLDYNVYDRRVTDKLTNSVLSLSEDDFGDGVEFYLDGELSDFGQIGFGDVLSIYDAASGNKRTVYISKNKSEGIVTRVSSSDYEIELDGVVYTVNMDVEKEGINIGDRVKIGFDIFGYGVTCERYMPETKEYAYLLKVIPGEFEDDEDMLLKLVDKTGEIYNAELCDPFRVNGKRGSYAVLENALWENNSEHQLIYVSMQDGKVKEIFTAKRSGFSDDNSYSGFTLNYESKLGAGMIYGTNIASKFIAASETQAFYIPLDDYNRICRDEVYAGGWSQLSFKSAITPEFCVYDADADRIAGAVVVYGSAGDYDKYLGGGRVAKTNIFLVEKTGQCIDKDNEERWYVEGMFLGMPRTFYAPDDVDYSDLRSGDIIKPIWYRGDKLYKYTRLAAYNEKNATAKMLAIDYDYEENGEIAFNTDSYKSKRSIESVIGTVVEVGTVSETIGSNAQNNSSQKLSVVVKPDGAEDDSKLITLPLETIYKDNGGTYMYVYNTRTRSAYFIKYSDIELVGKRVYGFMYVALTKALVIYE